MAKIPNIYHSALANMGPVLCKIDSDVLKSKWQNKDGTDKFYVNMTVAGEQHSYTTENDACAAALENRKGQTLLLTFSGSRDDAEISIGAAPASAPAPGRQLGNTTPGAVARQRAAATAPAQPQAPAPAPAPAPQQPASAAAPPPNAPRQHGDPVVEARLFLCRRANALGLAADAALYMITEFAARHGVVVPAETVAEAMVQEMARNAVPTLYIALKDSWRDDPKDITARIPVASLNAILAKHDAAKAAKGGAQ